MLLRFIRFRATVAAAARHFSAESAVGKAIGIGGATARAGGGGDTLGRRLFSLVYAKRSAVIAIGKWKAEGHKVQKYQLNRIVRELRKLKRYKHALENNESKEHYQGRDTIVSHGTQQRHDACRKAVKSKRGTHRQSL